MNNKNIEEIAEALYPLFLKRIKNDRFFKNVVKIKNATVKSITTNSSGSTLNQRVKVKFPYDTNSFTVTNRTGEELEIGDNVCLMYWIDLKNAVAIFKVK